MICEKPDFMFPLTAEIYYPIVEQGAYGSVDKQWNLDATIACALAPAGRKNQQEVQAQDINIRLQQTLLGRTKTDIRISSQAAANSITNIIVTNVKDVYGNEVYKETSGPRAGSSTLFELATNEPIIGAFGKVEYYKIVLRRSDNQATTE